MHTMYITPFQVCTYSKSDGKYNSKQTPLLHVLFTDSCVYSKVCFFIILGMVAALTRMLVVLCIACFYIVQHIPESYVVLKLLQYTDTYLIIVSI